MPSINGEFSVVMTPQKEQQHPNRASLEKHYFGTLSGSSSGQMLSIITPVKGSAGYVAIETFTGQLDGRSGSFSLQHYGLMNKGEQALQIQIIPDSGSGELSGIVGAMQINIEEGKHYYTLSYQFEA